ncbi:MAG: tetratricopeptide repeat protein [Acholeplasmatales bacterium]|nr:tetratricopeptide repeat protein [Acholeplasmatales bacterium]
MKLLGIKVKQEINEALTNSIHSQTSVSQEYIVPPVIGRVKNAPSYASFINNKLNLMNIKEERIIINFNGEIIKVAKDEPASFYDEQRVEVQKGIYKDIKTVVYFELVYEEEVKEVKNEEVQEEKPKTIYDVRVEMYDEGRYSECREITKRVLDMALSDKNYKDVIDFRLDLLELNARLDEGYLNREVLLQLENDLKSSEISETDKLELYRTVGKNFMNLNDYESAEKCYRKALSLTDREDKINAILKEIYMIAQRRMYDTECFMLSYCMKRKDKLMELEKDVVLPIDYVAHDPIENTQEFQEVIADAMRKVDGILKNSKGRSDYYQMYYRKLTDILKEEYGIDWKSPDKLSLKKLF